MEIDYSFMELPIFIRNKNDRSKSNNFIKNGLISFSEEDNYFYEFDEKIFYGLIILANISKSNQFITTYVEILKHSGILYNGATLKKLKDSIQKMKELEIICKELKITENIKKLEIINEISEISTESKEHMKIHLKITLNRNIYDEISFFNPDSACQKNKK